jgi:hypothetical protein
MCIPSAVKNPQQIGAVMTELYAPQSWKPTREKQIQTYMPDKTALNICLDMEKKGGLDQLYAFYNWYIPSVLWSDMGIKSQKPPQTFIAEIKESAVKDISDLWSGK